jgi:hypothetical protein
MNIKKCIKRNLRVAEIKINRATSYDKVKGRLAYRWFSDESLQNYINPKRELEEV